MGCSGECSCSDSLPAKSLLSAVDLDKVSALNERVKGSCTALLRMGTRPRGGAEALAKDAKGLVVKIPFMHKVQPTKLEVRGSFKQLEVVPNNPYVALAGKCKISDSFTLSLPGHIVPVSLPPYKYKSVDHLTLRLTEIDEAASGRGELSYLAVYGVVTGALPTAVNVSYELYSVGEKVPDESTKHHAKIPRY